MLEQKYPSQGLVRSDAWRAKLPKMRIIEQICLHLISLDDIWAKGSYCIQIPAQLGKLGVMTSRKKISVLLTESEAKRFESFCIDKGYKKSTLIARLIREHLEKENFQTQLSFLDSEENRYGNE